MASVSRRQRTRRPGGLTPALLLVLLAPGGVYAQPPGPSQWSAPDGEDHHTRPPGWDLLAEPEPPPFYIAPEYPLAAAFVPAYSGNYSADGIVSYDYVVVHTQEGSYNGTISWFQNPSSVVSAHYVMRAVDGEVTQMVLDKDRAYHVGVSNKYALGIEHEGFVADPGKWYTWATYSESALLTRWLTIKHAIPVERAHIVGHVELPMTSHTDPGVGWDWDLYMALIKDVVGPTEIAGVAVDRSKPCTLTATTATQVQRTPMPGDPGPQCQVPAGTKLDYWHARRDIDGHHRLYMPPGEGPCAGMDGLDSEGYIVAAHWSALCADTAMAAAGATVQLDGGAQTVAAADGSFNFKTVVGAHTVAAFLPNTYALASEDVDLAVYPGARLVIALDPVDIPDPTGDPSGTGDPTGDPTTDPTTDPTADPTADPPGGPTGDPTADPGETGSPSTGGSSGGASSETGAPTSEGPFPDFPQPALPDGYGQDDTAGCACTHAPGPPGAALVLLLLLGLRRRARASCPHGQV